MLEGILKQNGVDLSVGRSVGRSVARSVGLCRSL